ncbi:MAG: glutamine--tRNA ligase/YqeY domain fusion protein [Planctomycetota bacterium]
MNVSKPSDSDTPDKPRRHFIQQAIDADNASGRFDGKVITRFPPEPNGYLHIGHAKAICLNFSLAREFGGHCNLRFDDTNPVKEETEFVDAIERDIRWLGFDWGEALYASSYFETLYEYAQKLIRGGHAYVCELTPEETRELRGTLTEPGKNSPHRDRPAEESLDLLARMRAGEFPDGSKTLRAKIDMASPNLNMRDPVLYRILHAHHHRTGDEWCIYPMYDFAHGQSDSIESITHSLCSLEFENHRPLYDWFCEKLEIHHPQQLEFARLELTSLITSKRKLRRLVEEGYVTGWDDPRMPTLSGMRRRGYTPASIRNFCEGVGVAKFNSTIDLTVLENAIRDDLNPKAERRMAVLRPLKVIVTNYPEGQSEMVDAVNNPEDESAGKRELPFARELFIEQDDFREEAPRKYFRLTPGREVRLRYAYYVTCTDVVKDDDGNVIEVHCTYDPESRGGNTEDGRKVKGTIHWVSAQHAVEAEVRLYDRLFADPAPGKLSDDAFVEALNPTSLETIVAPVEPSLATLEAEQTVQFERLGYFCVDRESTAERPVFNRTVPLRDSWAKIEKKMGGKK